MSFEAQVSAFAAWQGTARITATAGARFDERAVVPATAETVLHPSAVDYGELARPLEVNFAFEIEVPLFVGDVAGRYEDGEGDPEDEGVDAEKGAVVEEDPAPADDRGYEAEHCRCSGHCSREQRDA